MAKPLVVTFEFEDWFLASRAIAIIDLMTNGELERYEPDEDNLIRGLGLLLDQVASNNQIINRSGISDYDRSELIKGLRRAADAVENDE